ncbi:magnesium transporter CorA family protein [Streptococcus macedonicus]|uniref:Magnesium transporter CorA family protein n=1 Tax=Streptococcus macedonicus TaxID=59310 RepID=A0AA47IJF0_STRMC|nr:magnesium transporter CorA family protein [Streptococcus macedonicus]MCW8486381.1 magnesium transporter CorA family protein [Streptococcus macedonicus]MCW8494509.1 magnesium transporter CorA family protein [Streptococcus macedonicus]MCW8499863.1 magnesium transporter CorA family protein [Streptococcus macedonicus]MCW8501838.1 magnesium transporter CorA family protein [Streptococcus macedonicus]MCW8503957.1 magnesium transporter CorA family protein [Streptococcus macedonicus]
MEQMFLSTALEFKEINTFQPGAWINLVNPSQEEIVKLSEQFNIDITDLRAPLDLEETSRIAVEDDYTLIIVDVPTYEERNNKSYYVTIPLGIIVTDNAVITTCLQELTLFDNFFNRRVKNFYTFMKTRFVFQLLYRNAELFLTALRSIDRQSDRIEAELENATRNEQLIDMMELEKSIVYLKASLKFNERIVKKLSSSTSSLKKYIKDEDLLEDTLIETQQAIEMAGIYENVLNAMTEATASIINNNQNTIMKTLALMTMALDIPTVIFSAYGMNFQNNWLPLNGLPYAFWYIVFIAAAMNAFVVIYFFRKKWF